MLSEQRLRDAGQRQTTFHAIGHRLGDEGTAYLSPETAAIGMLSLYLPFISCPFISCPFISWTGCEKEGGVLTTREYIVLGTEGKMRIRTD